MDRTQVLAIVQAGGEGSRMDVLTRERTKPALPVAGSYQLVDFPLSNLANSGVTDVWLSVQYQGASLEERIGNGRPWDLDRTRGGLRLLAPQEGVGSPDEDGFARGNADELFKLRREVVEHDADVVLVLSADHVYRLDLGDVVAAHLDRGDECTVVTTEVDVAEAGDHAVLEVEGDRLVGLDYKPDSPRSGLVAAEIVAYRPDVLVTVLEELHRELGREAAGGDSGLGDYGHHLLPRLIRRGRAGVVPLEGYWRDLGQPHRYLRAHREMLTDDLGVLNDPGWPIHTHRPQRSAARVLEGAEVADSLVSSGCVVAGAVVRSVLGPGVRVEPGARVVDSVVFADTLVEEGARVSAAIVDAACRVGAGADVGSPDAALDDGEQITLVGRECIVAPGVSVPAGSRLEPGTRA